MSAQRDDDLALLLEPTRAALHGEAAGERRARSVLLARARTLSGDAPRRRSNRAFGPRLAFGVALLALAAVVLVSTVLVRTWRRSLATAATPIAFSVGDAPGHIGERIAATTPRILDFDDGTRVELDALGALRVIALDDRGGRLLLEHGNIRASFHHRARTYWTVEAAGIVVEVTGTRFDVSFDQATQAFDLVMHEGSVRVGGCGIEPGRVVKGTEALRASCALQAPTFIPTDLPSAPAAAPAAPPTAARTAPASTSDAPRDIGDGSMALLQRADAERRAGQMIAAHDTLLELRWRYPDGAAAPEAAFDLGVLAFDAEGHFTEAARWFQRYLEGAPHGPLAREAMGRLMEAQSLGGDSEGSASSAARYLDAYPGGPHASLAKRLAQRR